MDTYTVIFASPSDKEEWWMVRCRCVCARKKKFVIFFSFSLSAVTHTHLTTSLTIQQGLDDVINVAKRQMSFGLKLHELMTINKHEFGRDVPSLLTNCIAFIEQHGTPLIFSIIVLYYIRSIVLTLLFVNRS